MSCDNSRNWKPLCRKSRKFWGKIMLEYLVFVTLGSFLLSMLLFSWVML
jgi:hypothetical protein